MSWITVDTKLPDHPKMAALASDTARWGWLLTLLEAKEQRKPGVFANERHYRHVLARHGKFLPDYIKVGLMDKDEDGTLRVHDWQRHQWAGTKAQQRETPDGLGEDKSKTFLGQEEDASRAVPVPVYVSSSTEGVQGEPDALDAFHRRTGDVPGPKLRRWIDDLCAEFSEPRVVGMIGETPMAGTVPDYLRSIRDQLRLQDAAADRAEKRAEADRLAEKRRPLAILPTAHDISVEDARRLAEEYTAEARAAR